MLIKVSLHIFTQKLSVFVSWRLLADERQMSASDMNGDGIITIADAVDLQRFLHGF
ncbi:MAG: hypothetical protein ACI4JD_07920 [Ruminococcus sp.]